jgi:hypothetical protein
VILLNHVLLAAVFVKKPFPKGKKGGGTAAVAVFIKNPPLSLWEGLFTKTAASSMKVFFVLVRILFKYFI